MTNQPISRIDLAKKTKLNKSTVTRIVNDLLAKDLVKEMGSVMKETSGRRPIKLVMNQKAGYVISIEIDRHKIFGIMSDLLGEIIYEHEEDLLYKNQELVIPQIKDFIYEIKAQLPKSSHGLIGIAIGVHGMVTENNLIRYAPYLEWVNFNLVDYLQEQIEEPIYINNEANYSVLGEHIFSYHYDNMISLNIKTGIGMGIIIDKHLYNGKYGSAGEIGHMIIVPNGIPCPCGNKGCFEQYASEDSFIQKYGDLNYESYLQKLAQNDPVLLNSIEEVINYLSIGINNILTIFNPQAIIINSKYYQHIPNLIVRIKEKLSSIMNVDYTIKLSKLGKRACVLGGAATVVKNFYGINYFIFNNYHLNSVK